MEKFSLKWNDFNSNVQKSFRNLRTEDDFFDIRLVGDVYKHVTAHKVVLSSCSEYFKGVFSNNKKHFQSHAFICLEGLNQGDLNNVLDYIYHGEVQIQQEELNRFLRIDQRFKLEGLIGGNEEEDPDEDSFLEEKIITQSQQEDTLVPKYDIKVNQYVANKENKITTNVGNISNLYELDKKVEESYSKDATGCYVCHYCAKSFKKRNHIKEHVEIHFEDLSLPCSLCDATHRCRQSLRVHMSKSHK